MTDDRSEAEYLRIVDCRDFLSLESESLKNTTKRTPASFWRVDWMRVAIFSALGRRTVVSRASVIEHSMKEMGSEERA